MRYTTSLVFLLILALLTCSCSQTVSPAANITIKLMVDGKQEQVSLPSGSSVEQALEQAQVKLGSLDRSEPDLYAPLEDGDEIKIVRVIESFEIVQEVIPFQSQTLHNESLPMDQETLIQAGKNGLREITYRQISENGVIVDSIPIPVKSIVIQEPLPEIRMVGIQSPYAPVTIEGQIYYLRDGNVWMMEGNTANREAILTTGDLDGRIFSISKDGQWLLFTRQSNQEDKINTLWAANLWQNQNSDPEGTELVDLKIDNIIHFADWRPGGETRIVFSTVEPRPSAPGWQANNDLHALVFSSSGWTTQWTTFVDANAGGIYGWWGTDFSWSPDQNLIAYHRPDGIGLVDMEEGFLTSLYPITPLQTRGDWAWNPGIAWSPQSDRLFTVDHPPSNTSTSPEESQWFDLISIRIDGGDKKTLVKQSGMFAYPLVKPSDEGFLEIAYLQAIFPAQSETSRYQVAVVDESGENHRVIFPSEGLTGLEPTKNWGAWSPHPIPGSPDHFLAVLYQGNLWLLKTNQGEAYQITGDNLTNRVIWK